MAHLFLFICCPVVVDSRCGLLYSKSDFVESDASLDPIPEWMADHGIASTVLSGFGPVAWDDV